MKTKKSKKKTMDSSHSRIVALYKEVLARIKRWLIEYDKKYYAKAAAKRMQGRPVIAKDVRILRLYIHAPLQPTDRAYFYEDPLDEQLRKARIGQTMGGGTFSNVNDDSIIGCDIEIDLCNSSADTFNRFNKILTEFKFPKGSKLIDESSRGQEWPLGREDLLCLSLKKEGCSELLSNESTVSALIGKLVESLKNKGFYFSCQETEIVINFYFCGGDFSIMKDCISDVITKEALCKDYTIEAVV